jgi:hypothetical protein
MYGTALCAFFRKKTITFYDEYVRPSVCDIVFGAQWILWLLAESHDAVPVIRLLAPDVHLLSHMP